MVPRVSICLKIIFQTKMPFSHLPQNAETEAKAKIEKLKKNGMQRWWERRGCDGELRIARREEMRWWWQIAWKGLRQSWRRRELQ
ncbi:uncharacterized protein DS421_7g212670 [Arachis hypogaea]|nr:uncharacterized protein DS421_7g212670 [Arachis hypogaea]